MLGGEGPLQWTVTAAAIPDLELVCPAETAPCSIRGTAPTRGPVPIELTVTDSRGGRDNVKSQLPIQPPPASPLALCESGPIKGLIDTPLQHRICVQGGYPPYRFALDWAQDPPPWLHFDTGTGTISGQAAEGGAWAGRLRVVDSRDQTAAADRLTLRIDRQTAGAGRGPADRSPQGASRCSLSD